MVGRLMLTFLRLDSGAGEVAMRASSSLCVVTVISLVVLVGLNVLSFEPDMSVLMIILPSAVHTLGGRKWVRAVLRIDSRVLVRDSVMVRGCPLNFFLFVNTAFLSV